MTRKDFKQAAWDAEAIDDCRQLIRLAVREDLGRGYDLTTLALVPTESSGKANIVFREEGVVAGLPAAELALSEMNVDASWQVFAEDGDLVKAGDTVAELSGKTRDLLTTERLILNLLGRLSGIATLTRTYVEVVASTATRIYDTRKTTPGWRRLEKYAVRCGGGFNHRTGLFDAILIKDNHLAQGDCEVAEAVWQAREFLAAQQMEASIVEIEVDTLGQFDNVLEAQPDIVLLDNMSLEELTEAVRRRDAATSEIELEASGGIKLESIRTVAESGVDRISVGALTHSAVSLDIGLDWSE
jgi:nicotinate-nucleotide pyrophosphorylase (carboxylating)